MNFYLCLSFVLDCYFVKTTTVTNKKEDKRKRESEYLQDKRQIVALKERIDGKLNEKSKKRGGNRNFGAKEKSS